jgi:hypothetical protein
MGHSHERVGTSMIPEHLRDIYIKVLKRRWGIKAMREGNAVFVWLVAHNRVQRALFPRVRREPANSNDCDHILEPR